jgi:hypothetical protein
MANDKRAMARLKEVGGSEPETLAQFQARKAFEAWNESGSREDAGAAYQKAESKVGRENVVPLTPESMDQIRRMAAESGRPVHPESGLIWEPETKKNVVGHSAEKKRALSLAESEGLSMREALEKVRDGAHEPKKSTRKGK